VKATLSNDVNTIIAILAPDYTITTFTGKLIHLKDYEASLKKRKASGQKPNAYSTAIEDLKSKGNTASVISLEKNITEAVDPVTNKHRKLVHIHRYLDTWINIAGTWRLKSTVTQLESTTVQ
jgi:hypothetical protein